MCICVYLYINSHNSFELKRVKRVKRLIQLNSIKIKDKSKKIIKNQRTIKEKSIKIEWAGVYMYVYIYI